MTNQAFRFNPPPGWPPPPQGWVPDPQWRPDPAWPPAPPGWNFWLPEEPAATPPTLRDRTEPVVTSTAPLSQHTSAPPADTGRSADGNISSPPTTDGRDDAASNPSGATAELERVQKELVELRRQIDEER